MLNVAHLLRKFQGSPFLPERRLLEVYPPFWFLGLRVVELADDYRSMTIQVPLRWYIRNMHNTMFGGIICAVADPMAALLCEKILGDVAVWSKRQVIEFDRPAKTSLTLKVEIQDSDLDSIRAQFDAGSSSAQHEFHYAFTDQDGHVVARVESTVYLRKKRKRAGSE